MKKDLYIDFDGVILDTISIIYNLMEEKKINKKDFLEAFNFIKELDWEYIIFNAKEINNSSLTILKLVNSKLYNLSILTHVCSKKETLIKGTYIKRKFKEVKPIFVPKTISKTKIVNPKDSILIDDFNGNLKEWQEKGGISIKFSKEEERDSSYPVISNLEEMLYQDKIKVLVKK
ncbi:MAG: hypothetical protein ACOXZR_04750 [Bacilli bacterium]